MYCKLSLISVASYKITRDQIIFAPCYVLRSKVRWRLCRAVCGWKGSCTFWYIKELENCVKTQGIITLDNFETESREANNYITTAIQRSQSSPCRNRIGKCLASWQLLAHFLVQNRKPFWKIHVLLISADTLYLLNLLKLCFNRRTCWSFANNLIE